MRALRAALREILSGARIGLLVLPSEWRSELGNEALITLLKLLERNGLDAPSHKVFFDKGIPFQARDATVEALKLSPPCELFFDQDSRVIGGIQIADLVAHSAATMLREQLLQTVKMVRASSFGDDNTEVELGFELWATTIRMQLFTQDAPKEIAGDGIDEMVEAFTLNTGSYALHVSDRCEEALRQAAEAAFGRTYFGCIS